MDEDDEGMDVADPILSENSYFVIGNYVRRFFDANVKVESIPGLYEDITGLRFTFEWEEGEGVPKRHMRTVMDSDIWLHMYGTDPQVDDVKQAVLHLLSEVPRIRMLLREEPFLEQVHLRRRFSFQYIKHV